ncbi:MAG TPA: DDE-type integrase/transposase/recombinase, partial [Casimicrobiaceae bacterium]
MARNVRSPAKPPESSNDAQTAARERFDLIEQFLDRTAAGQPDATARTRLASQFAAQLGISPATFYRLLGRHAEGGTVDALLPRRAGVKNGQQRLAAAVEAIVTEEIRDFYLTRERPKLVELRLRIHARCHGAGLRRPDLRTIKLRIAAISRATVHRKRYGGRAARERFAPVVGTLATERALQVVQIDHTKVDLFVVEETTREVLGRPWLTLAIDVHTRMIAGFYLSFDPPSVTSVAICLALAVGDKAPWLAALGVDGDWPVQGVPERVHLDNGREFHAQAFAAACARYAIPIDYRPVRTPHYGGHIERLIGTLMGRVHMLPGTTFSSVEDRQDYDSARHATLSLGELERWLALEIVGRYHAGLHAALHMSPLEKWRQATGQRRVRMPPNPRDFLIDFLPFQQRRVRRD